MCGRASRNPELASGALEQNAPRISAVHVAAPIDSQEFPVVPEELDAIEAYLMPQIIDLLQADTSRATDSEVPQCQSKIAPRIGDEGGCHEILTD